MITRLLLAAAVFSLLAVPVVASAAPAKHHRHHAARVSTATFRTPVSSKPPRELRASRPVHEGVRRVQYAAGRRHVLTRGS